MHQLLTSVSAMLQLPVRSTASSKDDLVCAGPFAGAHLFFFYRLLEIRRKRVGNDATSY
jgi:hypothetical protein